MTVMKINNYNRFILFIMLFLSTGALFAQAMQEKVDAYKKKLGIPSTAGALKNQYAGNPEATVPMPNQFMHLHVPCAMVKQVRERWSGLQGV